MVEERDVVDGVGDGVGGGRISNEHELLTKGWVWGWTDAQVKAAYDCVLVVMVRCSRAKVTQAAALL